MLLRELFISRTVLGARYDRQVPRDRTSVQATPARGLSRRAGFLLVQLGTHRHRRFAERLAPLDLHPRHFGNRQRLVAWQSVIATAATVRILGSASVDMAGVASGRLGVFLQANLNGWDWYPGAALVIGAGGVADELVLNKNRWQIAGNVQAVEDVKTALQLTTGD